MSYAKNAYQRSNAEKLFLVFFLPLVIFGYSIYKFPNFFVSLGMISSF